MSEETTFQEKLFLMEKEGGLKTRGTAIATVVMQTQNGLVQRRVDAEMRMGTEWRVL